MNEPDESASDGGRPSFTRAQIPRALPENELAARAGAAGLKGQTYPTVAEALAAAKNHARRARHPGTDPRYLAAAARRPCGCRDVHPRAARPSGWEKARLLR